MWKVKVNFLLDFFGSVRVKKPNFFWPPPKLIFCHEVSPLDWIMVIWAIFGLPGPFGGSGGPMWGLGGPAKTKFTNFHMRPFLAQSRLSKTGSYWCLFTSLTSCVPLQIVCTSKVKVTLEASVTVTSQLIVASSHHSKAAAFSLLGRVRPPLWMQTYQCLYLPHPSAMPTSWNTSHTHVNLTFRYDTVVYLGMHYICLLLHIYPTSECMLYSKPPSQSKHIHHKRPSISPHNFWM